MKQMSKTNATIKNGASFSLSSVEMDKLKAEGYAQADALVEQANNPIAKIAAKKAAEIAKREVDKKAQKLLDASDARCNKILEDAKAKSAEKLGK